MKEVCNMKNKFDYEKVQEAIKQLLIAMGQDIERPGLIETPRRVAGYWQELLEGENYTNKEIAENFKKDFIVSYSNLVVKEVKSVLENITLQDANNYANCIISLRNTIKNNSKEQKKVK